MTTPELLFRAIFNGFELSTRKPDSRPEPAALTLQISFGNVGAINLVCAFLKPHHTTDHDSVRNPEPLAAQFVDRARKTLAFDLLRLVKVARKEPHNSIERFLLVVAVSNNSQLRTTTRSERQNAEDRLRVGFGVSIETLQRETALKLHRHAYEVRGGACVKTETTGDFYSSFSHCQSAPALDGGSSKA